ASLGPRSPQDLLHAPKVLAGELLVKGRVRHGVMHDHALLQILKTAAAAEKVAGAVVVAHGSGQLSARERALALRHRRQLLTPIPAVGALLDLDEGGHVLLRPASPVASRTGRRLEHPAQPDPARAPRADQQPGRGAQKPVSVYGSSQSPQISVR